MDFGAIISRAIKITWKYKVLWILGFLAALGPGSIGGGGNFNYNFGSNSTFTPGRTGTLPLWMQDLIQHPEPLFTAAIAIGCLLFIIGIVFAVIGLIAHGGLIAGVQQIETDGTTTFGSAWKSGAARFWPMLGLNLLVLLPFILLMFIFVILFAVAFGGGGVIAAAIASDRGGNNGNPAALIGILGGGITVICCVACVLVVYGLIASALITFGERAIMIEKMGVMASLSRAWGVFRANLGNIILMALLMGVIAAIFGVVTGAVAVVILAPTMLPAIQEIIRGVAPGIGPILLAVGGIIVASILGAIVRALFLTFNSAAWTLAFRQFTGIAPAVTAPPTAAPPLPAA